MIESNTLSKKTYDTLIAEAKAKANRVDNDVAIVVWDVKADGTARCDIVEVPRRHVGNDMTKVSKLLDEHSDAELLEVVGADY